jgi:hypothetical protein
LIAIHFVQSSFGSIYNEVGWVVSKETLAHVDYGLFGGGSGTFIDDRPEEIRQKGSKKGRIQSGVLQRNVEGEIGKQSAFLSYPTIHLFMQLRRRK